MDYEKKYKEALERARKCWGEYNELVGAYENKGVCEEIFPELRESEDEKIRKELKTLFLGWINGKSSPLLAEPCNRYIAWLEEQGEHKKFRDSIQVGDKVTKNEDGVLVNLSQLKRVAKKDEQILANSAKTCKDEQKRVDKVEPKFKVGDWVVRNGETLQISGIDTVLDRTFHYWFTKGTWLSSKKMENAMFWTIQDAKDGDVLYESYSNTILIFRSQTCGWIKVYCDFWINKNKFTGTCSADYGRVSEMDLKPATKEQRDLLFQKMHEAGYEWNAEKKELKKIEQPKQEWSEEDTEMIDRLIRHCKKEYEELCNNKYGHQEIVSDLKRSCRERWDWLESLKNKIVPQSHWKPTEEQMVSLARASNRCVSVDDANVLIKLLEQLKEFSYESKRST